MTYRLITPPVNMAVSLADARTAGRLNGTALDTELEMVVRGITEDAEHATGRAFITQTWRVTLDSFPDAIRLAASPVQSVASVKYLDVSGVEQTLDPLDYTVDLVSEPAYIAPAPDLAWPTTYDRINAVYVDFVCGYGSADTDVPSGVKSYILAKVASHYAPAGTPELGYFPRLLDRYRVY
jgi:uncharacterized phiE125 gp8 family phage protein